jgi:GTPase
VNMRFISAEVIREKVILNTEQEIPHSVAIEVEQFTEREDGVTYISAIIYVERDSQKGIIIGKGGDMIKRIGTEARLELEDILSSRVFVELHVKVLKNWRSNIPVMRRLGYRLPKPDER